MLERMIPSTGEKLPVIGMGTWQTFNVFGMPELLNASEVMKEWHRLGGRLIDSSPMYGKAEQVVGDITKSFSGKDNLFYATKVWIEGARAGMQQMKDSFKKMGRGTIDLMQVHNMVDCKVQLPQLRKMKDNGKIRYIGITHYTDISHMDIAHIIKTESVDFVQFNYSLFDRHAEKYLLQLAEDKGVAVLVNRPFGEGSFFEKLSRRPLPDWATAHNINTWAAFILKYIIAHPAVTCVIPATRKREHAISNAMAGQGFVPDNAFRNEMVKFIKNI